MVGTTFWTSKAVLTGSLFSMILTAAVSTLPSSGSGPSALVNKAVAARAGKGKTPHASSKAPEWVHGVVFGEPFQVKRAFYGDGFLFLRTQFIPTPVGLHEANRPDACNGVQIAVPTGQDLQGKRFSVQLTDGSDRRPDINLFVVSDSGAIDGKVFQKFHSTSAYSMVLQFFRINKGLLPGYIELHLTDTTKRPTTIKGYFYAQPGTGNVITPPGVQ